MDFCRQLIASAVAVLISASAIAETTIVHAGQLLAVPGEDVAAEQSIIIEDDAIMAVIDGYVSASDYPGAAVIDLKNHFVMPGLMDMHVHLQGQLGPNNDRDTLKMLDELVAMRSLYYAQKTLRAGFTTVRDVGSQPQSMYALRDAINNGWIEGPRIIAAGGVGITGGHADVSGVKPDLLSKYTSETICDGPYDCRRATRHAIKFGADLIKITSTGGVLTDRATGTGQQMEADELREVVLAAERMGRKVASHAHQEDGIIAALEAGVHSIEHGTYTGPEAIKLFKKTGAYLVPTLIAGDTVKTMAETSAFMSPPIRAKAIQVGNDMAGNFEKAHKAGVRIAFGTDSGVSAHGTNAREAVLMHQAGMAPMDILVSATINAADLIDMSDTLGTLETGKQADIVATSVSPLEDIAALQDMAFVMRAGSIIVDP
ncbi:MAG: amidohydrolase family protein [Pseudomonadota bacterium]